MRIPSGVTDQYIYFVAQDTNGDRVTGLSSFTVYRSRNGGVAAAFTTPTINETDSTNMPGVYELLLDEDMTIDSGDDSQEMAFHITASGMVGTTRTIELYRPKITAGETATVASGLISANATQISGDSTAADNAELFFDGTGYNAANSTIGTCTTNTDMRGTDSAALASVCTEARLAELDAANIPTDLSTIAGYIDTEVAAILAAVDTEIAAIKAKTDQLQFTVANMVDANIQYVNDVAVTGDGQTGTEWGP